MQKNRNSYNRFKEVDKRGKHKQLNTHSYFKIGYDILTNDENLITNKKTMLTKDNRTDWENIQSFSGSKLLSWKSENNTLNQEFKDRYDYSDADNNMKEFKLKRKGKLLD